MRNSSQQYIITVLLKLFNITTSLKRKKNLQDQNILQANHTRFCFYFRGRGPSCCEVILELRAVHEVLISQQEQVGAFSERLITGCLSALFTSNFTFTPCIFFPPHIHPDHWFLFLSPCNLHFFMNSTFYRLPKKKTLMIFFFFFQLRFHFLHSRQAACGGGL